MNYYLSITYNERSAIINAIEILEEDVERRERKFATSMLAGDDEYQRRKAILKNLQKMNNRLSSEANPHNNYS